MEANVYNTSTKKRKYVPKKYNMAKGKNQIPFPMYKQIKNIVQKGIDKNLETKSLTDTIYNLTSSSTGTYQAFSRIESMQVGTALNERIGDKIKPVFLKFKFNVVTTMSTVQTRIILFQMKNFPINAITVASSIIKDNYLGSTTVTDVFSDYNFEYFPLYFKILYDEIFTLGTSNQEIAACKVMTFSKLHELDYAFATTTGGGTGTSFTTSGGFGVVLIDNGTASTTTYSSKIRLFYKDA